MKRRRRLKGNRFPNWYLTKNNKKSRERDSPPAAGRRDGISPIRRSAVTVFILSEVPADFQYDKYLKSEGFHSFDFFAKIRLKGDLI